jgi:hypothetical protein
LRSRNQALEATAPEIRTGAATGKLAVKKYGNSRFTNEVGKNEGLSAGSPAIFVVDIDDWRDIDQTYIRVHSCLITQITV